MKNRHKQIMSFLYIVLGIIFIAVGSWVWFRQLKPYYQANQSASWQPVTAVIISIKGWDDWAEPGSKRHRVINYFVDIRYSYKYKNKNYVGDRYSFYKSTTDGKKLYSFINATPPGTEVVCFVNPAEPAESVIIREKRNPLIMMFFAIPSFLVGFYFVFVKSGIFRSSKTDKEISEKSINEK